MSPRALGLHLLLLVVTSGCLMAAWWQVHRAMQGNTLSYLYSVEWPAFAVVAVIGWWQLVHDTPEDIARRKAYHAKMRAASAEVVARTLPRSARAITVSSSDLRPALSGPTSVGRLADGLRSLPPSAWGTAEVRASSVSEKALAVGPERIESAPLAAHPLEGLQKFDGPLEAALLDSDGDGEPQDPMTAYNRYLASLAVNGKPKTWRNPRGL